MIKIRENNVGHIANVILKLSLIELANTEEEERGDIWFALENPKGKWWDVHHLIDEDDMLYVYPIVKDIRVEHESIIASITEADYDNRVLESTDSFNK